MHTIDTEILSRLQEVLQLVSPVISNVPPQHPAPSSPGPVGPVTDELIRSCVTPRKVPKVHQTLEGENQRHRCAIKLLPYFFSKEELTVGNTDGNFNKEALDRTKLHLLKGKLL